MKALILLALFVGAAVVSAALVFGVRQPAAATPSAPQPNPAMKSSDLPKYSKSGHDVTPLSHTRVDELAKQLTPEEAKVILAKGTERAFCGNLVDNHKEGVYVCRLCGLPLFASDAKFDSGTGWPSFFRPFDPAHIREEKDTSYGMVRTEITCARCDAHLGHVFDDGPKPTGLRYCLNSVSLVFYEKGQDLPPASRPVRTEVAYVAGGCFWGVEDRFQQLPGVVEAVSGYMGGHTANPTYEQVCEHTSGHAETVKVIYDPARITYRQVLEKFFRFHDPTQLNRQGPDIGDNYRSAIFAADDAQLALARQLVAELQASPRYAGRKIVTQLVSAKDAGAFYPAEEYHQDYHAKHGGHCALPPE
jgi:peptide methionine sulfoxide reductase msrA/msrB